MRDKYGIGIPTGAYQLFVQEMAKIDYTVRELVVSQSAFLAYAALLHGDLV
jgi:hypothetical protein